MRKATHLACQKLAGSLALVTCKDPLRQNMPGHIRSYLSEHGFTEQMVPEQVIMLLVQDNVDVACEAIERAAMDRAIREADNAFSASFEARRRHREIRPGQQFWDPLATQAPFIANLPEPLHIKPNGLQPHQWRLYEDFGAGIKVVSYSGTNGFEGFDNKRRLASRPSSVVQYVRPDAVAQPEYPSPIPGPQTTAANSAYAAQEQFNVCL